MCLCRSNCIQSKHADFEVKIFRKIFVLSEKKKDALFFNGEKAHFPPWKNDCRQKFLLKVCLCCSNHIVSKHADFEVKFFLTIFFLFLLSTNRFMYIFELYSCPQAGCRGATLAKRGVQGVSP